MTQDVQLKPLQPTSSMRRVGIYATVLLVVFSARFHSNVAQSPRLCE